MNTKERIANMLMGADGEYISGSDIAGKLGITRAAVWKNIRQLKEDGFEIEGVQNKGYRIGSCNDAVSEAGIMKCLGDEASKWEHLLEVIPNTTSTNDVLKARVDALPGWYTLVAASQSAGKGRRTRSFYSPSETGVYLSMVIKLPFQAVQATRITTAAAVAACRAIEERTDSQPWIKWVNDVFVNGKKVCGILTEASISMESGGLDWAVMGIGFNVYEPDGGFPPEIADIAGFISEERAGELRNALAASFMVNFRKLCCSLMDAELVREYKRRSFMKGLRLEVIKGDLRIPATALDIDDDCQLIVRYDDGKVETLMSGEVSIKI